MSGNSFLEAARKAAKNSSVPMPAVVPPKPLSNVKPLDELGEEGKKSAKPGGKKSGNFKQERGFEKKEGKDASNKFTVSADVSIPILPGPQLGPLFLFKELKLKGSGSASGEEPFALDSVRLQQLKHEIQLDLLKLDVPKSFLPKPLTLGGGVKGSGSVSGNLDAEPGTDAITGSAGVTANIEQGVKVEDLIPDSAGALTLSGKLGGSVGANTAIGGEKPGTTLTASGEVGGGLDYESPALRGGFATFGGLLGDETKLGLGASTGFSISDSQLPPSASPEDDKGLSGKASFGGKASLKGERAFLEINVNSQVQFDSSKGSFKPSGSSFTAGAGVGFKF